MQEIFELFCSVILQPNGNTYKFEDNIGELIFIKECATIQNWHNCKDIILHKKPNVPIHRKGPLYQVLFFITIIFNQFPLFLFLPFYHSFCMKKKHNM